MDIVLVRTRTKGREPKFLQIRIGIVDMFVEMSYHGVPDVCWRG